MVTGTGTMSSSSGVVPWNGTTEDLLSRIDGAGPLREAIRGNRLFAPLEASVTSRFRGADGRVTLAYRDPHAAAALAAFANLAESAGAEPVDPTWRRLMDRVGAGARKRPIGCMASVRFSQAGLEVYPAAFVGGLAEHRSRLLAQAFQAAGLDRLASLVTHLDASMSCGGASAYAPGLVGMRGEGARAQARVYTASESPTLSMKALGGPVADLLQVPDAARALGEFAAIAMDEHPDDPWSLVVSFELDDRESAPGRIKVYVRNPVIGPTDAEAHRRTLLLHSALGESVDPYLDLRARLGMSEVSEREPAFLALGISIDARATTVDTYVFHPSHIARIAARAAGGQPEPVPSSPEVSA